jgi:hypothetical protein
MKYLATGLASGLFPLLFASNLFALNLCDSSCNLSITFPDGGSIKADDDLKITFGEGGYINNGSGTIAYSAGEKLKLDDNESLVFQNGGLFDLGRGGNIKYKDMQITSDGTIELAAVNGDERISIDALALNGNIAVNISSDLKVEKRGELYIKDGLVTATADLTFTNKGSVKGNFQFEDAVLTYSDEDDEGKSVFELLLEKFRNSSNGNSSGDDQIESQEISGIVYIDTGRQFTVVTKAVSLDSGNSIPGNGTAEEEEAGSATQIEGVRQLDNPGSTDSAVGNSVSVSSAGGLASVLTLAVLSVMLALFRLQASVRNNF